MDIVEISDVTDNEASTLVKLADEDDISSYPSCFRYPFAVILKFARNLPPSKDGKTSTAHLDGNTELAAVTNIYEIMGGYENWAVPTSTSEAMPFRKMRTQMMYGYRLKDPYEQVQRMFAAPLERKLKKYSQTEEFKKGSSQLYILLIQIHPSNTNPDINPYEALSDGSYEKEGIPKVWRLVVCHADTNLDSLHDQIIGPAMGWRRHYHGYKFVVPTSGATFGPRNCDAIDMMHWASGYAADSEEYDLRHVLRKPGQKLHYTYDLGDYWRHEIILVGREDRGTTISTDYANFKQYKHVYDSIRKGKSKSGKKWTLEGNALLAGMINCPPEDSNGCDEMGNYGTILVKGKKFVPAESSANWHEHEIYRAYDFDLKAHQRRFKKAVKQRKNYQDGCLQHVQRLTRIGDDNDDADCNFRNNLSGKGRKFLGSQCGKQEIVGKKTTSNKCANCLKQKHANTGLQLFACGRCKAVSYCGRQCQLEHWKRVHKEQCKPV